MLKRMKKLFKKDSGFTLVELLAVIAILAIIVVIAVPSIGNVISDSEDKAHKANVELVENAAKMAAISEGKTSTTFTLKQLEEGGYLEDIPENVGDYEYREGHNITVENSIAVYEAYSDES
ncbi:prepilin-type N-terminal cleavage/methylation domain-containing protein [Virgibacillus doumboii]|uniref:prepilin-type N-terminal cleavage/methylation domain-containing protein n=1 Tax=Virgibacillus doumboii TaxID=2697503 RepID=UPI0013DF4C0A|nr:prepilin-type N-terminal cleavage/methylation domain-containing protein [Virgibacillus doumboii]